MNFLLCLSAMLFFSASLVPPVVRADPLTIDLTQAAAPATASPYGPGTSKNPHGEEITADSRSFFLNGKPWIPIVGEFHYARYPRAEWREELLKMKSGGVNTVSTYVFWIHHEEEQGKFDWSGQRSLRDFLTLCKVVGLKSFVRMGPWCHGEVRNGGFPDWVQNSGTGLRTNDPRFLALVEPFYKEQARQMQGLLWKDGGPVIGIQVDNENDNADYLLALKAMAQKEGVDVPFYAITGWQGGLPRTGLIPLFGGYSDGFWGGSHEDYRKEYLFTDVRAMNDLGAQMTTTNPVNSQLIAQFPYACVEIGGGMMSSYGKRIKVLPDNIAAIALSKLGSGNNMPGYYMYQGGTNPSGKLSYLNEDHPNQLPVKTYDFQAPLGSAGQVREQYNLLRQQHLFLQDFGSLLARMPAFFPDRRPSGLQDFDTLRWDVRSDGKTGFLFFNNQQPYEPLPEHKDVQFQIHSAAGTLLVPRTPVTIPPGSYGIWPLNMECDGVTLAYATAQPICHVSDFKGTTYFFTALSGVAPELLLHLGKNRMKLTACEKETLRDSVRIFNVRIATTAAVTVTKADKTTVSFVVLTPDQGRHLWRLPWNGRDRAILSHATVIADGRDLHLQANVPSDLALSVFPAIKMANSGAAKLTGRPDGVFTRFALPTKRPSVPITVSVRQERPAGAKATNLRGTEESSWDDAAVYTLAIPSAAANRHLLLNVNYVGDAAQIVISDKLFDDNYYNGDAFPIPLWRIPASEWTKIRLKVLPYSEGLRGRLPEQAQADVSAAEAASTLDKITVTTNEPFDGILNP